MHMKCALTPTSSASLSLTLPVALSRPHSTTHTPCLLLSLSFSRTHRAVASHTRIAHKIKLADFSAVFHQVCLRFPAFSFFSFYFHFLFFNTFNFFLRKGGTVAGVLRYIEKRSFARLFPPIFMLFYFFVVLIFNYDFSHWQFLN